MDKSKFYENNSMTYDLLKNIKLFKIFNLIRTRIIYCKKKIKKWIKVNFMKIITLLMIYLKI